MQNESARNLTVEGELDVWTVVAANAVPVVLQKLEQLVDFSNPPDFVGFIISLLDGTGGDTAGTVFETHWIRDVIIDNGLLCRVLLNESVINLDNAKQITDLALRVYPNFGTLIIQVLLRDRLWPEEVPTKEIVRALLLAEHTRTVGRLGLTLMKCARHSDLVVRANAARLLARYSGNVQWMTELFNSSEAQIRAELILGLGQRFDIDPFHHIVTAAAADQSLHVSTPALAILARGGHPLSSAIFAFRVRSKNPDVRSIAVFAQDTFHPWRSRDSTGSDTKDADSPLANHSGSP